MWHVFPLALNTGSWGERLAAGASPSLPCGSLPLAGGAPSLPGEQLLPRRHRQRSVEPAFELREVAAAFDLAARARRQLDATALQHSQQGARLALGPAFGSQHVCSG